MKAHLITPSGSVSKERFELGKNNLSKMGFKCKSIKKTHKKYLYYAGTPKERLKELNKALEDEKVDYVFAARGGMGTVHLIDGINYKKIKNCSNKIFVGYSDITLLHLVLCQNTKIKCIHGPNLSDEALFTTSSGKKSTKYLLKALNKENYKVNIGKKENIIVSGHARGKIIGGNLSLIIRSLGTPYEVKTKGKILFFEQNMGISSLVFDTLWQLKLAGKFEGVKGVILGDFRYKSKEVREYLVEFFKKFKIPVIMNQKIGHIHPNISIPYEETCIIDTKNNSWEIVFD